MRIVINLDSVLDAIEIAAVMAVLFILPYFAAPLIERLF